MVARPGLLQQLEQEKTAWARMPQTRNFADSLAGRRTTIQLVGGSLAGHPQWLGPLMTQLADRSHIDMS